jgi:hypothetical protein
LSFFYAANLLCGVSPVKGVGFASLFALAWCLDLAVMQKVQTIFSKKWMKWMTILVFPIVGAIAFGTLKG